MHIKKECQFGTMTLKNITYLKHTALNKTYMARVAKWPLSAIMSAACKLEKKTTTNLLIVLLIS